MYKKNIEMSFFQCNVNRLICNLKVILKFGHEKKGFEKCFRF